MDPEGYVYRTTNNTVAFNRSRGKGKSNAANVHIAARSHRIKAGPSSTPLPSTSGGVMKLPEQVRISNIFAERSRQAHENLSSNSKRALQRDIVVGDDDTHDAEPGEWVDVDEEMPLDAEVELSAEGGEAENLAEYLGTTSRTRQNSQTWTTRIAKAETRWTEQLPSLVTTYLQYQLDGFAEDRIRDAATLQRFNLFYFDIFDFSESREFVQLPDCPYPNMNLLKQGCLSASPTRVSFAISLRTLEFYRILFVRQPRVSIQAFVRSICDKNNITYTKAMRLHFLDTYDVYLKIKREIAHQVREVLGRTDPDWRAKNSCFCCQGKVDGEEPMNPSVLGALDGNQSLKRVRLREGLQADPRKMSSSYIMSEEEVNVFRHDVKPKKAKSQKRKKPGADAGEDDTPAWSKDAQEATPADGDDNVTVCTERWKAAQSDYLKRMWAIYRETGIFLAACRHGFIWWICDMVESGELAKYPLAMVNQILRHFAKKPGLGYDIGCSFTSTVNKSSLAALAKQQGLRFVVPAFHGYAHRRLCQLSFHPLYVCGFGIEDLETSERIFASFNGLAPTTRYASQFHRHQTIDLYAQTHDDDKYQELSMFILNNYKQVQEILTGLPTAIKALQSGKSSVHTEYHEHIQAERRYLVARQTKELSEDTFACQYIERLIAYERAKDTYDKAVTFIGSTRFKSVSAAERVVMIRSHAFENYERIQDLLQAFETVHEDKITTRWTSDMNEWKDAEKYLATREYQKALSKLEGLVVARLFELHKMGLSGTGYKMRMHINKSLKTRCKAIQTALKKYNTAAIAIGRKQLDWKDISTYGSLAEFELLNDSRNNISGEPWADSKNREAASLSFRIERAKEERKRLDIECARLVDGMRSEESLLEVTITRLQAQNSPLVAELRQYLSRRQRQNTIHRERIRRIYKLPAYTGAIDAQVKDGSVPLQLHSEGQGIEAEEEGPGVAVIHTDDDDLAAQEQEKLDTFVDGLGLV